jgi:hypothetical protein
MIGQNEKTNKRSVEKQNIKMSDERDNQNNETVK